MKMYIATLFHLLVITLFFQCNLYSSLSKHITNYNIKIQLNTETKMLHGSETLSWLNNSDDTITDLFFHLYPNAFSNTNSTFMKELSKTIVEQAKKSNQWGYMEIKSISLVDGTVLTERIEIYDTVMRVPLPVPLQPSDTISVIIEFDTKLPHTISRMGYIGDHYDVTQWFPKIAVYTDHAWNAHQFHANSEFFADFGVYDVEITVPKDYIIEATGVPIGEEIDNGDGTKTKTFHAEDVHDFAWLADPNIKIARDSYDGVEIIYCYQPAHENQVWRVIESVKVCLKYYGKWFMKYPYPRIVIDDLPLGLSGGMEYPMLFTISLYQAQPRFYIYPELVTMHEFGHQYWYGILASNEFEEPWLDEGINSYTTLKVIQKYFGPPAKEGLYKGLTKYLIMRILGNGFRFPFQESILRFTHLRYLGEGMGTPINHRWNNLKGLQESSILSEKSDYLEAALNDPIVNKSWDFYPSSYNPIVYSKSELALQTLENHLGTDKMFEILRAYVDRHKFTHPKSGDFFSIVEEKAGSKYRELLDQLFYTSEIIDFEVSTVSTWEKEIPYGVVLRDILPSGLRNKKSNNDETTFISEVVVRRLGEVSLPVDIVMTFEDGERIHETWDGQSRWKKFTYERSAKLKSAEIDPERKFVLDVNFSNNGRTVKHQNGPISRLTAIWLFWLQSFMHFLTVLS